MMMGYAVSYWLDGYRFPAGLALYCAQNAVECFSAVVGFRTLMTGGAGKNEGR